MVCIIVYSRICAQLIHTKLCDNKDCYQNMLYYLLIANLEVNSEYFEVFNCTT